MPAIIPHHKGTDKLIGSLRAKVQNSKKKKNGNRERMRYAKLWRKGKYDGMMVSREFMLEDKDIIELHI